MGTVVVRMRVVRGAAEGRFGGGGRFGFGRR